MDKGKNRYVFFLYLLNCAMKLIKTDLGFERVFLTFSFVPFYISLLTNEDTWHFHLMLWHCELLCMLNDTL